MRVLLVNKFLYPNGGSETYIFGLGEALKRKGHEVQFFGMEHEGRCVGNAVNAYTCDMDFHKAGVMKKLSYAFKTIYSFEARKKIRLVLDDFEPDIVHLNNFNYQLTPSIIVEIVKWRRETNKDCKIYFTAHDYQLLCPNHMFNNPLTHENCEKCVGGHFDNCIKGKCIHGSASKSVIGAIEAYYWNFRKIYRYIDKIICCSEFMKNKMDLNPIFKPKTIAMHNFIEKAEGCVSDWKGMLQKWGINEPYVLYFGRYSQEKGIITLIKACKQLPNVKFVFAGKGEYAKEIQELSNALDVGFVKGEELDILIRNAAFTVIPSEWYENCPFSVMESQELKTPVLGADIGGIPELIEDGLTGWLFESGNVDSLVKVLRRIWDSPEEIKYCRRRMLKLNRMNVDDYAKAILQ